MTLYAIVHSYSGETLASARAESPVDALARYSMSQGYDDPRELACDLPNGEGDFFYLLPNNLLGMTIENYAVHARVTYESQLPRKETAQ